MFPFRRKTPFCTAVIVAAGSSRRMEGTDKVLAPLGGEPVICCTVRAFDSHPMISEIIVVTRKELLSELSELFRDRGFSKVRAVVSGGEDRMSSVQCGVACANRKAKLLAMHDGARPLVSRDVISAAVTQAAKTGAAAPAVPVKDTVKLADDGAVTGTPERKRLFAVQTPQVFDADLLRAALVHAAEKQLPVTDDCGCVEALGMRVLLTPGEERNLKITTPMDLRLAELWLEETV